MFVILIYSLQCIHTLAEIIARKPAWCVYKRQVASTSPCYSDLEPCQPFVWFQKRPALEQCACNLQVMSLVNHLGGTENHNVSHDTDAQDAQALFHRAGLMLRLGKQVCSYLQVRLPAKHACTESTQ